MAEIGATVAIIPARGGSKRLPRKNKLPLGGKPLIAWTIEAALMAGCFAEIVVSSDDDDILGIASQLGVSTHRRRAELATDSASTVEVMLDVMEWLQSLGRQYRTCVLLQPTSPLRTAADICGAVNLYGTGDGETVISVSELGIPSGWCGTVGADGHMRGFAALTNGEAALEPMYRLNGAIYVFDCARFRQERRYQTDRNRAFLIAASKAVDIDTEADFRQCEALMSASVAD